MTLTPCDDCESIAKDMAIQNIITNISPATYTSGCCGNHLCDDHICRMNVCWYGGEDSLAVWKYHTEIKE